MAFRDFNNKTPFHNQNNKNLKGEISNNIYKRLLGSESIKERKSLVFNVLTYMLVFIASIMGLMTIVPNPIYKTLIEQNKKFLIENKEALEANSYLTNTAGFWATFAVGAVAAKNTYKEYKKNQKWKRREFLDSKFKEFEAQTETINVRKMLDNEIRFVELFPDADKAINRSVIVEDKIIQYALSKNSEQAKKSLNKAKDEFEKNLEGNANLPRKEIDGFVEAAIRDNFDRFLDYLQQIEVMKNAKIIDESDLKIYLSPWIEILNRVKPETYRLELLKYMGLDDVDEKDLTSVQKSMKNLFEVVGESKLLKAK